MSFLKREWTAPTEFPDLRRHGNMGIDTETRDPGLKIKGAGWATGDGEIVGIGVSTAHFTGYYPVAHQAGGNLDRDKVFAWAKEQFSNPAQPKIFANAQYDLGWFDYHNIPVAGEINDVIAAMALLDENRGIGKYSLNMISKDILGEEKDETLLQAEAKRQRLNAKSELWKMHAQYVGPYGEKDPDLTRRLWLAFEPKLRHDPENPKLWSLYRMEMDLVPMLIEQRKRGVRIDVDKAVQLSEYFKAEEIKCVEEIHRRTGHTIDPNLSSSIVPIIQEAGIEIPLTAKTKKPSITAGFLDSLESIEGLGETMQLVLRCRKMQKANGTFLEGLLNRYSTNGRVHCSFHQLPSDEGGAISGRFSCTAPNLQQQPSPDKNPEIGLAIRSLYLPEEGDQWAALDYSQQEPRLTVHFAASLMRGGKPMFPSSHIAMERYCNDPNTDYHTFVAELTGLPRKAAKNINLGLAYGMGKVKLCHQLGLPTKMIKVERSGAEVEIEVAGEEGEEMFAKYNANVPFVGELNKQCSQMANRRKFIRTILGRVCRFPVHTKPNGKVEVWFTHKAMNKLIQGSAADQTKMAMLQMYQAGIKQLITVHDEVGISTDGEKTTALAKEIMETCVPLLVPSKVDVEIGPNWGEAR